MTTPTVTERIVAREPVTRDDFADEPPVAARGFTTPTAGADRAPTSVNKP